MNVDGKPHRTIWLSATDSAKVMVIDQRQLPHQFRTVELNTVEDVCSAISEMIVRGAPLIGVAAAFGMYLSALNYRGDNFTQHMEESAARLLSTRPTAINLSWALAEQKKIVHELKDRDQVVSALRVNAMRIADEDVAVCHNIGQLGLAIIRELHQRHPDRPVEILTHCNAGWLCAVDIGTATAPMYEAFNAGIPVHVWVDETRPRNQGASLTAWELGQHGVPYTLVTDNCGGHLMQNGMVDMVIVGTDRVSRGGDVANKIGTYLKALAAHANDIPFYVAAPSSSIDWSLLNGRDIPIEQRDASEVSYVSGLCDGEIRKVLIAPPDAHVANYGFDVTPRALVTGIITERGIAQANEESLLALFPEHLQVAVR